MITRHIQHQLQKDQKWTRRDFKQFINAYYTAMYFSNTASNLEGGNLH